MFSQHNLADQKMSEDERATTKARHVTMRRVQDYLYAAHATLGAACTTIDTIDVLHHPGSRLGSLNYMTPGHNIGWVQGSTIMLGLEEMRQHSRRGRLRIIEALFPPFFSTIMDKVDMLPEWKAPLWIYLRDGLGDQPSVPVDLPALPEGMLMSRVTDALSTETWRRIWHSPQYGVMASPVEALNMDSEHNRQQDILLYDDGVAVAAARIGVQNDVGHIVAMALMRSAATKTLRQTLYAAALDLALDQGCSLVFSVGGGRVEGQRRETLGFLDFGSMICYAASPANEDANDDDMGQPLLAVR